MWLDRLTGEQLRQLPPEIAPGRYWADATGLTLNGHTPNFSGLLVDDDGQRCQLNDQVRSFILPRQADTAGTDLLFKAITTIDADIQRGEVLISPLMPAAIVDDQGHLQLFEERLLEVVREGYLHRISQRPRLDMHYEDEVTDIARARRLSKGALVHLASHSECWQRQTLSGVIPRKVMARFSKDDYGIYENRVYARLLDEADRHLRARLSTLGSLRATLEQAMEFYQSADIDHRLARAVCDIWGMTFDESATSKVSEVLNDNLNKLQGLHKAICGLRQSGLYTLVDRSARVASALHRTNILSHDPNYRHVATLWELLGRIHVGANVTAEERFKRNQHLAQVYSRYAGLVLRRALQPYLGGKDQGLWGGRILRLRQRELEWELLISSISSSDEEVLLTLVPWLTTEHPAEEKLPLNRFIAWPAIGQDVHHEAFVGQWVTLSPSDMYCEERFGLLVDQTLQRMLLENYGQPLEKIPTGALSLSKGSSALQVDPHANTVQVQGVLTDELLNELQTALKSANAIRLGAELLERNQELAALQSCPVCKEKGRLVFQNPAGFNANCETCGTIRYLRGQKGKREYEQLVAGKRDFRTLGRRGWALPIKG
jgi:hypothetical protein